MKHRDEGSFEEIDESVAEQAERRAKVTNAFLFVCYIFVFCTPVAQTICDLKPYIFSFSY